MSDLIDALRILAGFDRRSPALLVQKPDGAYHVSLDGHGDGLDNTFIISRGQLGDLMLTAELRREDLTGPGVAQRLADIVTDWHQQRGPGADSDDSTP